MSVCLIPMCREYKTGRLGQDLWELHRFYVAPDLGGQSLFDVWEAGRAWGDSVTPATYTPAYRDWMADMLSRYLGAGPTGRLLSLGCGNAVIEAEVQRRGFHVAAVDVLPEAVAAARRREVAAVVGDVWTWDPPERDWDVILADGLLGHLYDPTHEVLGFLRRLLPWLRRGRGVAVVSNDAPVEGLHDAANVPGFHWLSGPLIGGLLQRAGFEDVRMEEFAYERPKSGTRVRAVVVARRPGA